MNDIAMSSNAEAPVVPVPAIKGFDKNLKCRDFQFEIGATYFHQGTVKACESGFRVITAHPLAVFQYYPPAGSRFCRVEIRGEMHSDDNEKTAAEILSVGREIGLSELIQDAVKWVSDRAKPEGEVATGYQGAASSTGDQGAASSTGTRGAASSTGDQGAASSTGYQGAASSTGYQGAAMAIGVDGRVMGTDGNALFLVHRDWKTGKITRHWSGLVGENGVEPNVWYSLNADGQIFKVEV